MLALPSYSSSVRVDLRVGFPGPDYEVSAEVLLKAISSCCILGRQSFEIICIQRPNLPDSDELVVFMTLPVGVDELIIPDVLASRDIPVHLTERYFARQGRYVEIRVPASRLEDARRVLDDAKRVRENLASDTEV